MAGAVRLKGNVTYAVLIAWDGVNFVNETARTKTFTVARGRSDDLAQVQAGTCNLVMADTTGRFNPANASSPLAGNLLPLRAVVVTATYLSVTYRLFTGYIRKIEADPGRDAREARIDCVDLMLQLSRARPVIAPIAAYTGGAIGLLLDSIDYTSGALRALDTGDALTFEADGSATCLALIAGLLETERGFFFIDADGVATYLDRSYTNRSPYNVSQGTIASTMRAIAPGVDLDLIKNRATVTATGGTPQTATDAASVSLYNYSDFSPITSDYLLTDAQALSLAGYLVRNAKDPLPPVRSIEIGQHDSATFIQLLAREVGDFVTVTEPLGGTSGSFHIQRIEHSVNWSAGVHRGAWALRQRNTIQPFIVGQSSVGGVDLITY